MRKTLVVVLTLAAQAFAGGFFLQLGNPEASAEARKLGAVLTIKATGCHDPATAKLTANAIGDVNGQRRTVPLEVKSLSEPGAFALVGTWPKEGKWVIELVATNGEQYTNTLVSVGPNGLDRLHAKADMHKFAAPDVDAMLR
jgi:D-arabinose 1-dehydrogenase-like Zn-dependent alcohol dehydrogenase